MQVQYARIGGGRWLADYDQCSCILSGANESSPLHTGKYRYLYISSIGPHIFLQQNRQTDRGNVCIYRSQTHECGHLDWLRAVENPI